MFAPGDRVFVRNWIGRAKAGTVDADHGDAVSVLVDGKKKPTPFARDRVRIQEDFRVIVGGPPARRAVPPPAKAPEASPKIEEILDAFAADIAPSADQIEATYQAALADGTVTESEVSAATERFMERPAVRAALRPPPPVPHPLAPRAPAARLRAVPKAAGPDRDAGYTKFVRSHKCCSCPANVTIEAHHWAWAGQKGMATKPSDYLTVPLCERCHNHFHRTGELPGKNAAMSRELFRETMILLHLAWFRILNAKLAERRVSR